METFEFGTGERTNGMAEVVSGRQTKPDRTPDFYNLEVLEKGFAAVGIRPPGAGFFASSCRGSRSGKMTRLYSFGGFTLNLTIGLLALVITRV